MFKKKKKERQLAQGGESSFRMTLVKSTQPRYLTCMVSSRAPTPMRV